MIIMNRCIIVLTPLLYILTSRSAEAAEQFDAVTAGFRVLWGLLIVLAIMFLLYYFLRKRLTSFQQQGKGLIKVIETRHILPKKTLLLIEVRGREYLVGAGNDTIGTIVPLQQGTSFSTVLDKTEKSLQQ
ncbi:MAG: flagellar biosynthetic protein FliO [Desulfopila sp.]|jgi:flagellar protein FliO/FliZ|nr:flagellar biosynthetic protein FliO [Desulfopila sp.]